MTSVAFVTLSELPHARADKSPYRLAEPDEFLAFLRDLFFPGLARMVKARGAVARPKLLVIARTSPGGDKVFDTPIPLLVSLHEQVSTNVVLALLERCNSVGHVLVTSAWTAPHDDPRLDAIDVTERPDRYEAVVAVAQHDGLGEQPRVWRARQTTDEGVVTLGEFVEAGDIVKYMDRMFADGDRKGLN
jgi:hypothetical protein